MASTPGKDGPRRAPNETTRALKQISAPKKATNPILKASRRADAEASGLMRPGKMVFSNTDRPGKIEDRRKKSR